MGYNSFLLPFSFSVYNIFHIKFICNYLFKDFEVERSIIILLFSLIKFLSVLNGLFPYIIRLDLYNKLHIHKYGMTGDKNFLIQQKK